MKNVFEQASRMKLKYSSPTRGGQITTEDLWDLSLEELDGIAKAINKKVKESSEESFIKKQTTVDKKSAIQLEVVVSIINTKLDEQAKRELAAERKKKRDQIIELMADKENAALARKSVTALRAELDKIDAEEEALETE